VFCTSASEVMGTACTNWEDEHAACIMEASTTLDAEAKPWKSGIS